METTIKTLIIKKKGRKYFDCKIGKYSAKLIINDVSKDLQNDRIVKLEVNDISERNKYGVTLKFEPIKIIDDRDGKVAYQAAIKKNEAEKWLKYAESDAADGRYSTKAIHDALDLSRQYDHLNDRVAALKEKIKENKSVHEAQEAEWEKAKQQRYAAEEKKKTMRVLYPLSDLPATNTPTRLGGRVVVFESSGKRFKIDENHPSYEGSHLLGHEGDYGCYCYYRDATDAEIAALESQESAEQIRAETAADAKKKIDQVEKRIIETGEMPEGSNNPAGERYHDTQNMVGGGDWFLVGKKWIWYIRNNGMDGDDWSRNNVQTAGAGAIGWRIPYDQSVADQIIETHEIING